jgi:hypothetical protein
MAGLSRRCHGGLNKTQAPSLARALPPRFLGLYRGINARFSAVFCAKSSVVSCIKCIQEIYEYKMVHRIKNA